MRIEGTITYDLSYDRIEREAVSIVYLILAGHPNTDCLKIRNATKSSVQHKASRVGLLPEGRSIRTVMKLSHQKRSAG